MDENRGNIIIYRDADNSVQLDVRMEQETVWLTQRQIADLFGVKKAAISKHVSNIFSQGELIPEATVSKMETVQIEGTRTIREPNQPKELTPYSARWENIQRDRQRGEINLHNSKKSSIFAAKNR